jgi:hypothetical protein
MSLAVEQFGKWNQLLETGAPGQDISRNTPYCKKAGC